MPKQSDDIKQDARIGYQAAIALWVSESGLVWNRLGAMIVANTIILTLIGIGMTAETRLPLVLLLPLCGAGIILCILWLLMTARGYDYLLHYRVSAEDLEKELQGVDTVSGSKKGGMTGRTLSYVIIIVFVILYLLLGTLVISYHSNSDSSVSYAEKQAVADQVRIDIKPTFGISTVHVEVMNAPSRSEAAPTAQAASRPPQGSKTQSGTEQGQPRRTPRQP